MPENLEPKQVRPDLLVNVCKVCGCRHFELTVEPIVLATKFTSIGRQDNI